MCLTIVSDIKANPNPSTEIAGTCGTQFANPSGIYHHDKNAMQKGYETVAAIAAGLFVGDDVVMGHFLQYSKQIRL